MTTELNLDYFKSKPGLISLLYQAYKSEKTRVIKRGKIIWASRNGWKGGRPLFIEYSKRDSYESEPMHIHVLRVYPNKENLNHKYMDAWVYERGGLRTLRFDRCDSIVSPNTGEVLNTFPEFSAYLSGD